MRHFFLTILILSSVCSGAQKLKKEDQQLVANLRAHVAFLASDKLEGRRMGSEGERQAALYISGLFKMAGLQPKGTDGYLQPFEITEGRQVMPASHLFIDGRELRLHEDYFPLSFSANGSVEAMPSLALQEEKMPWFIDLKEILEEGAGNPHFDLESTIKTKLKSIHQKGATAALFYNSGSIRDSLRFDGHANSGSSPIPAIYLSQAAAKKYLSDEAAAVDLKMKIEIAPKTRKGVNVAGFIDNGAANTVILGAHFDHLGWGEDGSSLHRSGREIHNGADDNASGTAALIELGRLLKGSKLKSNNYLLVAFSGEELGLYGSKYFVEHPGINLASVNYMINMDMVGRLDPVSPVLHVGGYGTTPSWGQLYNAKGKKKLFADRIQFRYDSSGTGPSDHTSFYNKGIPVLFYFTGLHSDYHKPGDDANKINYTGTALVVKHIFSVLENADRSGRLAFTRTREAATGTTAKFSVTLGIMPDYTFNSGGVRADGVTDGRPAHKAGLKTGDIVTGLGNYKINSMEDYMQALAKFKKGDRTTVHYLRDGKPVSAPVEF